MFHLVKTEWRKIQIPVVMTTIVLSIITSILSCTLYQSYSLYHQLEAWEIGTEMTNFVFPLIVVLPLCWSLYYERKNNFLTYVAPRINIGRYLRFKWGIYAVSAFFLLFIPYVVSAIFALYVNAPMKPIEVVEGMTGFRHIFDQVFINMPFVYALCLSAWKGMVGVLVMTLGFLLALYIKNVFVILTGPFVYVTLENFILAVLGLEKYRLVVSFEPTSISNNAFRISSFFTGPAILGVVIFLFWVYFSKIKKVSPVEV